MNENIRKGKKGEHYLEGLCLDLGINYHPPKEDLNGWDYFCEIPNRILVNPGDENEIFPVYFQVKTTHQIESKISIPILLSNWKKMIRVPEPFFIFIVSLDEDDDIKNVYLKHVNEKIMKTVLEKLIKNENINLN